MKIFNKKNGHAAFIGGAATINNHLNYLIMETIKRKTMYWRNPTKWEIKFGEGAIHYIEIDIERVIKPNGTLKKWFIHSDGLRYYR